MVELFVVPLYFFFQAEDGIRDIGVTGVQTCALPIFAGGQDDRGGSVIAFDLATGKEKWTTKGDGPGTASPIVVRSEERRVGKECRSGREAHHQQKHTWCRNQLRKTADVMLVEQEQRH